MKPKIIAKNYMKQVKEIINQISTTQNRENGTIL